MQTQNRESRWKRLQRGQALVEYWPTIPAAVAIMIGAGILTNFINGAFLRTANALDGFCATSVEVVSDTTELYNHRIETSASVYDPTTNRTTISYTVTSGSQPSISHWVLGLPKAVADNIMQTSEPASWTDSDPTTGATGLKFDIGYESNGGPGGDTGGSGGNGGNGGNGGIGGNGGNGGDGGKKNAYLDGFVMASYSRSPGRFVAYNAVENTDGLETRVIIITLYGNYEFGTLNITTKAGSSQVGTGTVSGPISLLADNAQNGNANHQSEGC